MGRVTLPLDTRELQLTQRMSALAARQGGVVNAADARALGARTGDLRRLIALGLWRRIRRGVYLDVGYQAPGPDPAHAVAAAAALAAMAPGVAVSHRSGVRLLGLPRPPWLPAFVELTRSPSAHGNPPRGTIVHRSHFDPDELTYVDGIPVLGGARLAVDACHILEPPDALAVVDGLLRAGMVTPESLAREVADRSGAPYHRRAALIVSRADGGAENWFESISRWWMLEAGLPRPTLQVALRDTDGRVRARLDMLLEAERVAGEADGRGKYATGDPLGILFAEKRREDWIRQTKRLELVRWVPEEMRTARGRAGVMNRWDQAIDRAKHLEPSG